MGAEDGAFELWSWPYKWMHDFKLSFRVPKYTRAMPGKDVAPSVTVRPVEIIASFVPDVHLAWPASLGGQYVAWHSKLPEKR